MVVRQNLCAVRRCRSGKARRLYQPVFTSPKGDVGVNHAVREKHYEQQA